MGMNVKNNLKKIFIEGIFTIIWLWLLRESRADNMIYLICAFVSLTSLLLPQEMVSTFDMDFPKKKGVIILAVVFAAMITVSNFDLYVKSNNSVSAVKGLLIFGSTIMVFYNILRLLYCIYSVFIYKEHHYTKREKLFWLFMPFLVCLMVDWIYLFFVACPGNLTNDSMAQIENIISGQYSNHHPVYHTMLIKGCFDLANFIGAGVNGAVLTYSLFQSILMAAIFAYTVKTMCEMGISRWGLAFVSASYALLPYHWAYSVTMGKDVIFGGVVLCFVVTLYRCRCSIGSRGNDIILFISTVGFVLLRSNGLFAFVMVVFSLLISRYNKKKKILSIVLSAFTVAVIMKGPVLTYNNVIQPDTAESLSIPLQQVARYISEEGLLNEEEYNLLNSVMDVSQVKERYAGWISDPIKNLVRERGGNDIISGNRLTFLKVWVSLGLKQPTSYVSAWVDLTRAYLNASYSDGMIFYNGIIENDYGIVRETKSEVLNSYVNNIEGSIRGSIIAAIGLCVWLYVVGFGFSIMNGRRTYLEVIPLLAIVLTLLIATPVGNEFRYVYALFTSIPAVGAIVLKKD